MTIHDKLVPVLMEQQDLKYRSFHTSLLPDQRKERFIGVRIPILRAIAKTVKEDQEEFFNELPHMYYEEDMIHIILISQIKDYDKALSETERFLPYIDNWAVCDGLSPKVFAKHREELMSHIRRWISDDNPWIIRFGIEMLMSFELDDAFRPEYNDLPCSVHSDEYYVNMMQGWYYATALAKHWDETIPYVEEHRIDPVPWKMTVQKAIDSFRITDEQKEYLRSLRRKSR